MTPIAFHVMHALQGRPVIFTDLSQRADGYQRALRIGRRFGLLVFALGSDHAHSVVLCAPNQVGRWAHDVECAWQLGSGLAQPFGRYHAKPVLDQGHLRSLVRYVLRQDEHHAQLVDPFHVGTNGPDLCRGRLSGGGTREVLARALPRLAPSQIEGWMLDGPRRGLAELGVAPAGHVAGELEARLVAAAASGIGRRGLERRDALSGKARRALLQIVESSPLGATVVPERMLGCGKDRVWRIRAQPVDPAVERVVRWQVEFRFSKELELQQAR